MASSLLNERSASREERPQRSPLRILFFLPGLMMGGAECHALDLMQRLRARGLAVSMLVHGANRTPEMEARALEEGATILGLKGMSSLRGWFVTRAEIAWRKPDVIVCNNQSVAVVSLVLRRLGLIQSRIVCIFHTTVLEPEDKSRFFLFRWTARWLDRLVFLSERHKRYWDAEGLWTPHPVVIENGVDFYRFDASRSPATPIRRHYGIAEDAYLVGILAAMRPEKNHLELIRALGELTRRGLPIQVLLVGDGAERGRIEAEAARLGVFDRLIFAGVQQDVRPYVLACDACVLCSSTETFSLATLEILALGRPMVSSRVGAQEQLIEDGVSGLLYDSGDVGSLADALANLHDLERRAAMAQRARASVAHRDIEIMAAQYHNLLAELAPCADARSPAPRAMA